MNTVIDAVKQEMRAQVWDLLESERAVQHGVLSTAKWRSPVVAR